MSDYQHFFDNLQTELEQARRAIVTANTAHVGQLARIVALKEGRKELKSSLFSRFYKVRHGLESFLGAGQGFPILAVDGDTPRDPMGLINQVRETVDFLRDPKVDFPAVDVDGVQLDPPTIGTHLTRRGPEWGGS